MSLFEKGASPIGDEKLVATKAMLNPNAAEFVPFSLRSSSLGISNGDVSSNSSAAASRGKNVLDRSESSVSNTSDEEAQQYWRHQLPDDINLDFKVMTIDESQETNNLLPTRFSSIGDYEGLNFSPLDGNGFMSKEQQESSPNSVHGNRFTENMKYPRSSSGKYLHSSDFRSMPSKSWVKENANIDQLLSGGSAYDGNTRFKFINEPSSNQPLMGNVDMNPLVLLASQFPGFSVESLAEVYFANQNDLNITIEMLTQLELQIDGGFKPTLNPKVLSAPNLNSSDFPSLSMIEDQIVSAKFAAEDVAQNTSPYKSGSSFAARGDTDFASVLRKTASQDSSIWRYDRNGSTQPGLGSSRNSQLTSPHNSGQGRVVYGDRLQNRVATRASPLWLETGEAVANIYSEMREEARDHARVRNSYFEQARQAYLIGNKALAKELSIKGQLHNMQMKAAHLKAQESIFHHRNSDMPVNVGERMIDLHGLHVNEAIHVLRRELAAMKNAARIADQRYIAFICVGTGHHTKGSRTPARLPTAVQRYLLDEGLDFSEPQPGLLRVVIY